MSIWLEILGIILLVIGTIFCVLPIIPGQILTFGALVLRYFYSTNQSEAFPIIMLVLLVALIVVTILDYVVPAWVVRKKGGSKYGSWGAFIGMLIGIIFTPIGMIAGMMLGAFIGEMIANSDDIEKALRISVMTFFGFLLSVGLKLTYAIACWWLFFTM
ncbi:MAG: DUF456 domain-containing protein [Bacteroidales bacterium]|jgi:uncharacterized protein YqgC (DUF456 family)|nr:DUF456 domain-containing protein [Bacteroidales bacterium]